MRALWLLGLLAACDMSQPPACNCVPDPDLGVCSTGDEACETPIDVGDGKADGSGLPFQHVTQHGGRVLAHAKVWTIAWPIDAQLAHDVDTFHAWMLQSPYWRSSLGEYGVGAGRAMGVVIAPGAPPARLDSSNDPALPEQIVNQLVASGALPPPDAQSVYSFIVPQATQVPPGTGGYHQVLPNLHAAYEVMTQELKSDGTVDLDEMTYSYAHETAEVATDPYVDAWYSDDVWFGEVGDLCNNLSWRTAPVGPDMRPYKISRLFSNTRAAAGLDPCRPVRANASYRGVVVTPLTATVQLDATGNGTTTMTLQAFSSDPNVKTVRWTSEYVNSDPTVAIQPDHGVATVGTPVTITVTASGSKPTDLDLALDFITHVPAPNDPDWNAGEIAQWNTQLHLAQ
jgi:hypothetical protein